MQDDDRDALPTRDALSDRGRSLEEDYFRKKDQELVEKMRLAASRQRAQREMGDRTGLHDPEMLEELQALGFTPETVVLLPLMPVVQVAWAEGHVTAAERALVMKLARSRGIADGSAADRHLSNLLDTRPDTDVFTRAMRLIRAMLSGHRQDQEPLNVDDLVAYCEAIAAASGGLLGLKRISGEERAVIETIAAQLKGRNP